MSKIKLPSAKVDGTPSPPPILMSRRTYTTLPRPTPERAGPGILTMSNSRRRYHGSGRHSPNRRLWEVLPDGSWKGRRCFIIGGGPSAKNFPWEILRGELVIGVNRAFEFCDPTIIFSMDTRFWGWVEKGDLDHMSQWHKKGMLDSRLTPIRQKFQDYEGFKCWLTVDVFPWPDDIYVLDYDRKDGMTSSLHTGLGSGGNSGFGALNLALCLGASPIYLVGFDMKGENRRQAWFHNGYPMVQQSNVYSEKFLPSFERAMNDIRRFGARIINLSSNSALKCFEFGKIEDIKPIHRPLIISYYTKNTGYEREIARLRKSVRRFGLEYEFVGIESRGSWMANTSYKAEFILKMMNFHPGRDLLFLDADSELVQYPELFDDFDAEFAVHQFDWSNFPKRRSNAKELSSAVIYLKDCKKARDILKHWIARNEAMRGASVWEQKNLQWVIENKGYVIQHLPASYCQIFDSMASVGEPVIEQHQASRRLRGEVGG